VSKPFNNRRKTVELRPSRIRREPPPPPPQRRVTAYPTERETWTVVIGVLMFALAIAILTFRISDITAH
jgi:hypothetical protein